MKFRVTAPYGEFTEIHPRGHSGVDIGMPIGTPLQSVQPGVVDKVVDFGDKNIGRGVLIRFEDGTTGIYGHMKTVVVDKGQHVDPGQLLGYSGSTGRSTGPHLHFGLKDTMTGEFLDPSSYIDSLQHTGQVQEFLASLPHAPVMESFPDMVAHHAHSLSQYLQTLDLSFEPISNFVAGWIF